MNMRNINQASVLGFLLDDLEQANKIDDEVFYEVKRLFSEGLSWQTVQLIISSKYPNQSWVPEFMAMTHKSYI